MMRFALSFCLGLLAVIAPGVSLAFDDAVEVNVLPGWRTADGRHIAALEMVMQPGWKTYWRAPGDVGIPPQFDWRPSGNLDAVEMIWPTPSVTVDHGLRTIGYKDRLVLPMELTPSRSGKDVKLKGRVQIGVCKEVCLPLDLKVTGTLDGTVTKPDPRIVAALANQPFSASEAGVAKVACNIAPASDGIGLRVAINVPKQGQKEAVVVELKDPDIWVEQPKVSRSGGQLVAETQLQHLEGKPFALNRSDIRLTVIGQGRAVDIQGCPAG